MTRVVFSAFQKFGYSTKMCMTKYVHWLYCVHTLDMCYGNLINILLVNQMSKAIGILSW